MQYANANDFGNFCSVHIPVLTSNNKRHTKEILFVFRRKYYFCSHIVGYLFDVSFSKCIFVDIRVPVVHSLVLINNAIALAKIEKKIYTVSTLVKLNARGFQIFSGCKR